MYKYYFQIITVLLSVVLFSCNRGNVQGSSNSAANLGIETQERAVSDTHAISNTDPSNSQWRGNGRDGVYNETGLLKEWPEGGPQLLWSYEGIGEGFSSAAISDGNLYITGLSGNNLILYVFDLNGQLLNRKEVGREESNNYPGPRSTLTINDGKLYIYNAFGRLVCLDKTTLNEVWSKEIIAEFNGRIAEWGMNESPLIVGDKLFITPGGVQNNVVALNKNTGATIWTSAGRGSEATYCSPMYISGYSVPILVTSTAEYIIALNADTGENLWSFQRTNQYNIHPNTPIYHNGMIFATTGYGGGSVMLRLIDDGKAVELAWRNNNLDNQMGGAIRIGNYIYAGGHNNNNFFCIDWNTGETIYRTTSVGRSNIITADGMLYCYSERGNMYLVRPNSESFDLASSFRVTLGTNQHWAHTVIHNGVLYIRHGDALMAYRVKE